MAVALLADHPQLVRAVGLLRWQEWGQPPEPEDPEYWVDVTGAEAGRNTLPVTWVAIGPDDEILGAVGLGEFDIDERRDRSPWVLGMVVGPDERRRGVGRLLLAALADWAIQRGGQRVWVATGGPAVQFYRACGYEPLETFTHRSGEVTTVLCLPL